MKIQNVLQYNIIISKFFDKRSNISVSRRTQRILKIVQIKCAHQARDKRFMFKRRAEFQRLEIDSNFLHQISQHRR